MNEKTKVSILGKDYLIKGQSETQKIKKIADHLNDNITTVQSKFAKLTREQVLVLAAMNIIDDYMKKEEQWTEERNKLLGEFHLGEPSVIEKNDEEGSNAEKETSEELKEDISDQKVENENTKDDSLNEGLNEESLADTAKEKTEGEQLGENSLDKKEENPEAEQAVNSSSDEKAGSENTDGPSGDSDPQKGEVKKKEEKKALPNIPEQNKQHSKGKKKKKGYMLY